MRKAIEAKVQELFAATNILEPPVDLDRIAAHLHVPVRYEFLPKDISGFLHRDGEAAAIVVNKKHMPARQRFTIAHEIGHLVFNHNRDQVHVDKTYLVGLRRDGKELQGSLKFRADAPPNTIAVHDPEETQANAFAGALLMPRKMLERDLEQALRYGIFDDDLLTVLVDRYEVSMQALVIQLNTLNMTLTLAP